MGIAVVILFLGSLAVGALLVTLGIRGRLVPDDPRCVACRQLVGTAEVERSQRCPECGAALSATTGVSYFRRRSRGRLIVCGVGVGLLSLAGPPLLVLTRTGGGVGVTTSVADLAQAIESAEEPLPSMALAEAERRAIAGELTGDDLGALSAVLIDQLEARRDGMVLIAAGHILSHAQQHGVLTADDLSRVATHAFWDPMQSLRPAMRHRDDLAVTVTLAPEDTGSMALSFVVREARDNGTRVSGPLAPGSPVVFTPDVGDHVFEIDAEATITFTSPAIPASIASTPVPMTLRRAMRVVPADAPPILDVVDSPTIVAAARNACRVRRVAIDRDSARDVCIVRADLALGHVIDHTLSYIVEVDVGDVTVRLGSFRTTSMSGAVSTMTSMSAAEITCPPPGTPVRVRLRPDPIAAEGDGGAVRVVGGEIVLDDVPVLRGGTSASERHP